jgi:hypothetical protein
MTGRRIANSFRRPAELLRKSPGPRPCQAFRKEEERLSEQAQFEPVPSSDQNRNANQRFLRKMPVRGLSQPSRNTFGSSGLETGLVLNQDLMTENC